MPELQYQGAAINYGDSHHGSPLMLLHSGGSSGAQWRKTDEHLAGKYRLLTPDFYGHGGSDAWNHPAVLQHDDQADLVAAVVKYAGLAASTIDIVGHSYGGAGAIRMMLRKLVNIRSLVLIEPMLARLLPEVGESELFTEYEYLAHGFLNRVTAGEKNDAWRFFLDYRNGEGHWDKFPEKTQTRFLGQTDATHKAFQSNLSNPTTLADIASLNLPITIVCGERTTAPDRRVTELLRDTLTNMRYAVIPGAEHMSPLTHPAEVAAIIERHLSDLVSGKWR
jgi:pimeloyl-ACP methyl ester carboxylesterase